MNTYIKLWQYLAEFLLEWEMFLTKVVEKTKTHFMSNKLPPQPHPTTPPESCHLWDNVEKYCRAGQATDDIIWRMIQYGACSSRAG
jgi:hypothetical protein